MFGSPFRSFEEDPFFRDFHENHRRMMGGFYGGPFVQPSPFLQPGPYVQPSPFVVQPSPFMAITTGDVDPRSAQLEQRERQRHRQPRQEDLFAMSPFGGFGMMDSMFRSMEQNFERMANDPNSHTYSQSSVMSFSNAGSGAPQFYEATSSTTNAPGGVREERKTVKDSRSGTQKMSISHQIGDREHRIEKSKDARSGDIDENQEFVNMDETDAASFDHEFKNRTSRHSRGHRHRRDTPAIAAPPAPSAPSPPYREREEDEPARPQNPSRRRRPEMHDV